MKDAASKRRLIKLVFVVVSFASLNPRVAFAMPIDYVFGWTADVQVTKTSTFADVPFELRVTGDSEDVRTNSSGDFLNAGSLGPTGQEIGLPAAFSAVGGVPELQALQGEIPNSYVTVINGERFDDAWFNEGVPGTSALRINVHVPDGSELDGYDLAGALDPVMSTLSDEAGSFVDENFFDLALTGVPDLLGSNWGVDFNVMSPRTISFSALARDDGLLDYVFSWTADVQVTKTSTFVDVPFELRVTGDSEDVRTTSSGSFLNAGSLDPTGQEIGLPAEFSAIGGGPELQVLQGEIPNSYVAVIDGERFDDARFNEGVPGNSVLRINVHVPDGSELDDYDLEGALNPVMSTLWDEAGSFVDESFFDLALTDVTDLSRTDWNVSYDLMQPRNIEFSAITKAEVPVPNTLFLILSSAFLPFGVFRHSIFRIKARRDHIRIVS